MAQGYNARLDESLGMRRGKESGKMQSYKDRRDESRGARSERRSGGSFNLRDGAQAGEVKKVPTDSEKYDMGRVKSYSCGSKGYPAEAWNYKY
jgi:hypothetical protein